MTQVLGTAVWSNPYVLADIRNHYPILLRRNSEAIASKLKNSGNGSGTKKDNLWKHVQLLIRSGQQADWDLARNYVLGELQVYGASERDFQRDLAAEELDAVGQVDKQ